MSEVRVAYRDATAADVPLIMDSWLNSWRTSPWAGIIPNNTYYPLTRRVIEQLIMRGAKLTVACKEDKPDVILGWACTEQTNEQDPHAVIHYIYVKDAYVKLRSIGRGFVSRCAGKKPGLYTFRSRQTEDLCREAGFRHAPEVARRK